MEYSVREIKNRDVWNEFVEKENLVNILSSWEWIEFEKSLGFEVFTYGIFDNDSLKGVFAFRKINAKRGKYLILRQNTFVDWRDGEIVSCLVSFLKDKTKKMDCSFFRISPPLLSSKENEELFKNYGFKKSVIHSTDAQITTVLDLSRSLDDISASMRKNTRYMIRKGEKMGIEILNVDTQEYLDKFEDIYEETVKRNKWNAEDFKYILRQYGFLTSKKLSRMFVAKYKEEVLAIAIFSKFNHQVIYHHSASVDDKKDIPVMYVLMWEAIKYYKELKVSGLNFFGVCLKEDVGHPWYGLSLFKRGFGGEERSLMHSYDYPISNIYFFTRSFEYLSGKIKGL